MRIKRSTPIAVNGTTRTVGEWAALNGLTMPQISLRLYYGWTVEKAVSTRLMSRSQAGTLSARKVSGKMLCVGKRSPDFIPGRRKPRADRLKRSARA